MDVKLRKYIDNMRLGAYGVILFSAWSIVKGILYLFFDTRVFEILVGNETSNPEEYKLYIVLAFVILAFDFIIRLNISIAAINDSKGRKKGIGYIIFGAILLLLNVFFTISGFTTIVEISDVSVLVDQLVTAVVDICAIYALWDMLYCSIRVRLIRKEIAKKEEEYAG